MGLGSALLLEEQPKNLVLMARTNGYIYRDYRKGKSKKKRSLSLSMLRFVVDVVMFIALIASAVATVICTITPNFKPEQLGIVSVVVLAAPIIYIILVCTLFYWIIRWKWTFVGISLIFVIVGMFSVEKYYQIYFKQQATSFHKGNLMVMSYNICAQNKEAIVDSISKLRPSILCVQEYKSDSAFVWDRLGNKYTSTASGSANFSCEIFTNQRIIRQGLIDSLPRFNAIWADILFKKDTIRVVNLHLKSTAITAQDMEFVEGHRYVLDSARTSKIRSITDKLVDNNIYRSAQARKVRQFIDSSAGMNIIVCGDFNDIPLSYTYKTISEPMVDSFMEAGNGYRYTFNGFFRLLPIDYILTSENIEVVSSEVDYSVTLSDHYPIVARLNLKNKK